MKKIFLTILLLLSVGIFANETRQKLPIIPYPQELKMENGDFEIKAFSKVLDKNPSLFDKEVDYLKSMIKDLVGTNLNSTNESSKYDFIIEENSTLANEEYILTIDPSNITIQAKDGHGAFNAMQTLRQIIVFSGKKLPCLTIKDKPAYEWRGMHLDVSRHFFTMEYLKKHIDRLAFYKFNKFHLHLTDDQGWRIEIKKYPKLTTIGGFREFNDQDKYCIKQAEENPYFEIDSRFINDETDTPMYGGYYTQAEMKELIKYAEERHVEIIPEIDMPGHMMAAIKAYPELIEGEPRWGNVFSVPLCVCQENVYTFSKDILAEIIELFPSEYIHIGADEVDKSTWKDSKLCKKFMKENNIKDVYKLQSHFIHEMQDFIESKGKTLIGWDEVLEGGVNPTITVMYWRGWEADAPLKAVKGGNEVIMTPNNPLYFDYEHNDASTYNVYHMDIVYKNIPDELKNKVIGAQANVWTESIPTEMQADYQTYPRMLALAERVWTDDLTQYDSFSNRLKNHYKVLDDMGVYYRLPGIDGIAQENVFIDSTEFLPKSDSNFSIFYTLDGSTPTQSSTPFTKAVKIDKPTQLKFALFSDKGARGEIYTLNFKPSQYQKAVDVENTIAGLTCAYYDKAFKRTTEIMGKPKEIFHVSNIDVPKENKAFTLQYDGFIEVPETGIYSFFFTCDDGGVLYIGGDKVIDNDGHHSAVLKSGQVALEKGAHPFKLDFIEAGGGYTLRLHYSLNGSPIKPIPNSWFKTTKQK